MVRKMLLLIWAGFFLAMGGLWALRAQAPAPQKPTMQTERQTTAAPTQVDLSGTYAGTFNCESAGLMGDTTLTINGNEFTTADGKTGRITTSKSGRYTAVALQVNGTDPAAAPTVVSMHAKRSGNKLTLSPVAGAMRKCSFVPSRSMARGRKTPAATGTEVANPTAVPAESPMQNPSPSPTPMPTPMPNPSPSPSGSPTPMPSPGSSPSPSPAEPMPSPTPSPSPRS